jgi:hypothetical protein
MQPNPQGPLLLVVGLLIPWLLTTGGPEPLQILRPL